MRFHQSGSVSFVLLVSILALLCGGAWAQEVESIPPPVKVVAHALDLSESQVAELIELRASIQPEAEALAVRVRQLEESLEKELSMDDPAVELVGEIVVEIARTRKALAELHFSFVEAFAAGLEEEQLGRLQRIREAFQIREILPAFKAVGLLP